MVPDENKYLYDKELEEYVRKAKEFIENNPNINEQDTKTVLVDPLIEILGWDKFKNEVKTEYPIQMGGGSHRVDYALKLEGVPAVLMEVKQLGKDLKQYARQAISYGRVEDVKWVTLTNGEEIEIYNTEKGKNRDYCLLTSIKIDDYLEEKDTLAELLSKKAISEGRIDELDKKIRKKRRAIRDLKNSKNELENELFEIIKDKVNDSLHDKIGESVPKLVEDLIERVEGKKEPEDKRAEEPKIDEEKGIKIKSKKYDIDESKPFVKETFEYITNEMKKYNSDIIINPQKHYVSLRDGKNFAIIQIRKTQLNLIPKLPLEKGKNIVNKNEIDELSESVQEFYNSPCFRIKLKEFDEQKLDEVVETLKAAHEYYL